VTELAILAAVFAALYAGHQIGDHIVQTDEIAAHKAEDGWVGARAMAGHLLGYGVCQVVALGALAVLHPLPFWPVVAALVVSLGTHGFIDRRWPVRWLLEHTGSRVFAGRGPWAVGLNGMYLADQSLHVGAMFMAAWLAAFLSGGAA